jgi:hypothetical protein
MRDPVASMPGYGNPQRMQGGAGRGMEEDRARFSSDTEMAGDLRQVYDLANRNNTAIYALDPRGLTSFEYDIEQGVGDIRVDAESLRMTQNSLHTLAGETDGRAILNQNDLARGLRQVVEDTSTYYLLGYNSSETPQDGKFHEIKVRLKRRGLDVRHRKGYWALTPQDTARALEPAPDRPKDLVDHCAPARAALADPDVVRHLARRERTDARDVRLGADSAVARPEGGGGVSGDRHGDFAERRPVLSRPRAGRTQRKRRRRRQYRHQRARRPRAGAGGVRGTAGTDPTPLFRGRGVVWRS